MANPEWDNYAPRNTPHPSYVSARAFIEQCPQLEEWQLAFDELATGGHEHAVVLGEHLRRFREHGALTNLETIGLAWWMLMSMETVAGVQLALEFPA